MVNVTLTTLFEAIQLVPLRGPADDDDWKWTLRSVANRPILRCYQTAPPWWRKAENPQPTRISKAR